MSDFERKLREREALEEKMRRQEEERERDFRTYSEQYKKDQKRDAREGKRRLNQQFDELKRVLDSFRVEEMLRTLQRRKTYRFEGRDRRYGGPVILKSSPRIPEKFKNIIGGFGEMTVQAFDPESDPDSPVTTGIFLTMLVTKGGGPHPEGSQHGSSPAWKDEVKRGVSASYPVPISNPGRIELYVVGTRIDYDPSRRSEIRSQIEDILISSF